jgi:signal transduction histidine kinase
LGLSIARWVVDAHRGSIEVQSTPGAGSVFRVRFPLLQS